jgi:hypothetical protein
MILSLNCYGVRIQAQSRGTAVTVVGCEYSRWGENLQWRKPRSCGGVVLGGSWWEVLVVWAYHRVGRIGE